MPKAQVIIDTNMLLVPFTCNVDIFSQIERLMTEPYELIIVDKTLKELKKLKDAQLPKKEREQAKMALQLVEMKRKHLKIVSVSADYVDDQIVQLASSLEGAIFVATQDLDLRQRLKKLDKHIAFIILRQRQYLVMEK